MKKAAALILVLGICLSLFAGCGKKTAAIDLTDYMDVLFRGEDGKGTARADFDYSGFEKAVMEKTGAGEAVLQKLVRFESGLSMAVSPDRELKNGDKVTVTADYSLELAKDAGFTVSGNVKTVTVAGLSSAAAPTAAPAADPTAAPASSGDLVPEKEDGVKELDPFDPAYWNRADGIEVRYTGSSPYGMLQTVSHLPEEDPMNLIYYRFSEPANVHEGDKITVTAFLTGSKAEGYTLKTEEQEFTVGPVAHFLLAAEELAGSAAADLKRAAEEQAEAFAAGTLEFREGEDWTGFYNGETVVVNRCAAGDTVYGVRCPDGFIQVLLIPCYLDVTVTEADWNEDPKTFTYDLVVLCAADGIVVDVEGGVTWNRPELVQKGVKELEEELVKDQLTWYADPTLETVRLPG